MKGHRKVLALAVALQSLSSLALAADKPEGSEQLKGVTIEGVSRIQMKSDKPTDTPSLAPEKSIQDYLAQRINLATPGDKLATNLPILLPPRIASDVVLSPWRRQLWFPPVLSLNVKSPAGLVVDNWRLVITDDQGKIFRTIRGKKRLPDHIEWDGLSDSEDPLRVGRPYSCALSVLDRVKVPTYLTSKTVRIGSYVHERSNRVTVILDTNLLFVPGPTLSNDGRSRLGEARDWLRRHYKGSIRVDVYGQDTDLAQRQADIVRKALEGLMHLKEGSITARGLMAGTKDRYLRTEITAK